MRKSKEVELFGIKMCLYERHYLDSANLLEFAAKNDSSNDFKLAAFNFATVLSDSLKINLEKTPNYNLIKRFKLKKIIKREYLLKHLSCNEITNYATEIMIMEGIIKPKIGDIESTDSEDIPKKKGQSVEAEQSL